MPLRRHIVRGAGLDLHNTSAMPVLAMPYHRGGTLQTLLMKQMSTSSRQYAYSDALRCHSPLFLLHHSLLIYADHRLYHACGGAPPLITP